MNGDEFQANLIGWHYSEQDGWKRPTKEDQEDKWYYSDHYGWERPTKEDQEDKWYYGISYPPTEDRLKLLEEYTSPYWEDISATWYCGDPYDVAYEEGANYRKRVKLTKPSVEHYKNREEDQSIEPIDYIVSNDIGFLEGNVIKYMRRHLKKGGVDDLLKARIYLNWMIEKYKLTHPADTGEDG